MLSLLINWSCFTGCLNWTFEFWFTYSYICIVYYWFDYDFSGFFLSDRSFLLYIVMMILAVVPSNAGLSFDDSVRTNFRILWKMGQIMLENSNLGNYLGVKIRFFFPWVWVKFILFAVPATVYTFDHVPENGSAEPDKRLKPCCCFTNRKLYWFDSVHFNLWHSIAALC